MSKKNDLLTYEDYVKGIDNLKPEQQLHLVELLTATLKKQFGRTSDKRKITELDGLGAEIWKKIDVQDYIQKERDSWD